MTVERADYRGNVNIGFYGVVTPDFRLFADGFKKNGFFGEAGQARLAGTDLLGIFAAGNSNGIIIPDIVSDHEMDQLDELGIDYLVIEARHTAFGNLLLCNDTGCIMSKELEEFQDEIAEFLDVEDKTGTVAGHDLPGSCGYATNQGVLLHRDATDEEIEKIEDVLDVEADIGTVNFGTPYVHSGILADTEQLLVGNNTTGPEVQRVQDALGFL